jgi:hypothetical protein
MMKSRTRFSGHKLCTCFSVILLAILVSTVTARNGPLIRSGSFLQKNLVTSTLRGGASPKLKSIKPAIKAKAAAATAHHDRELMSSTTAVANVLADLCPHGMLPIGK